MEIYDYIVIEAENLHALSKEVNDKIDSGYQPLGGVAAVVDAEPNFYFLQAMGRVYGDGDPS